LTDRATREDEWLFGWDPTPGIVSVWASLDGRALVWRRTAEGELVLEEERFRPWILLSSRDDLRHVGAHTLSIEELAGPGELRFLVRADDGRALARAVLEGASRRLGRRVGNLRELPKETCLALAPEDQYLASTGRVYFRDLPFERLRRAQIDLETTGLDPEVDRIFLVAIGRPDGEAETHEIDGSTRDPDAAEADLLERALARVRELDPDVIENHNLHGFDLPFLARRTELLDVPFAFGRDRTIPTSKRASARGARVATPDQAAHPMRRARFSVAGRELVDTLDAVRRHDFSARDLPGHGLKVVAKHLGLARSDRVHIPGARIFEVFRRDPARVRAYAMDDVREAAALAATLGGAAFALARMAPRRYERLADAGAATGVVDPLLVRAYLREREALPAHREGDGTAHSGAALHLFATGVATRVVKADVASLYPSLMRSFRIGPSRDRLGAFLSIVDRLVALRLEAKRLGKEAVKGSAEQHAHDAMSAAMKLVVNSAYGYLGATSLTRFADVHAANEVTRRGREVLGMLCSELEARGVTLLEADTDGVYFSAPPAFSEDDERRVVSEVDALLPPLVRLEFEGRYAAMLSHEPKNYALLAYGATEPVLRGVAFRSSRAEPYGEEFLRRAVGALLAGDVQGVRDAYVSTVLALERRELPTIAVASRVRLTKTPDAYAASRKQKRELAYEALLASGITRWSAGDRALVYRSKLGPRVAVDPDAEDDPRVVRPAQGSPVDPRDYDVDSYVRSLLVNFASRLTTGLDREDFSETFADPHQPSLFARRLAEARPILTPLERRAELKA